ncbi:MAG: hypothetical protein ABSH47_10035 [Bryobacteraceae bacterium]|jgi:hypothetical protein
MTKWEYGYATFDGISFSDCESMRIGSPPFDLPNFFYCAGRSGWEFCATLPELRGLRFEEWQGPRNLMLIFKRATEHLPSGPFVPTD